MKKKGSLITLLAVAVAAFCMVFTAACGGGKIVYEDYTLAEYSAEDWSSKTIAYQLRDENTFNPMCFNLYDDHGLYAAQPLFGGQELMKYYGYWTEDDDVLYLTYFFDDWDEGYKIVSNLKFNADKTSFLASEAEEEQVGWVLMETKNGTSRTKADTFIFSTQSVVDDPADYWDYIQENAANPAE